MLRWGQYVQMSNDELATHDVAAVNLACAEGLPDAHNINVPACLDRIDYFARRVAAYTDRMLPQYRRKRYDYENSEAYFRAMCMVTVLQRDLGVKYNPAKRDNVTPLDTADSFIHGILDGDGGTCGTLPVLNAAVGRRLGYPLKLVSCRTKFGWGHLFCRWDDPDAGERFNMDSVGHGMASPSDEEYQTGDFELPPHEVRLGCHLMSMSPRMELANFLSTRGYRWLDYGNHRSAIQAFGWAYCLNPANRQMWNTLVKTGREWGNSLMRRKPANFPAIRFVWQRQFTEDMPVETEKTINGFTLLDNLLNDKNYDEQYWEPMRRGQVLTVPMPVEVEAELTGTKCRTEIRFL